MSGELQACARRIVSERHRRAKFLPAALFSEVGWEILLMLYAFDEATHTEAFVAQRLKCPMTVTDRWIEYLVSQQLVERLSTPESERGVGIVLTNEGRRRIENYLAELTPPA